MIFSEEINEILSYYFMNNEENFDFLNSINAKSIKKHSHQKNTLLINSSVEVDISSMMNEYKMIILNSQLQNLPKNEKIIKVISDINHWTFNLHSFDNIINIFNLYQISELEKFLQICFFALKDGGKLNFVFHSKNNFDSLIKKLIELDGGMNNQKIIQRFHFSNNFEKLDTLLQSYNFKNIAIIKESIDLNIKNINDFLFDKKYEFLFTKEHFAHSDYIMEYLKNDVFDVSEMEIFIVRCER